MSEHDEGLCGGNHSSLSPRQRAERWLNKHYGYWPLSNKERDSLTAEIEAAVAEATERERERCVRIAEDACPAGPDMLGRHTCDALKIAAAIRSQEDHRHGVVQQEDET